VPQSAKIGKSQLPLYPFRTLFSERFFASWSGIEDANIEYRIIYYASKLYGLDYDYDYV